jgi:type VI secretion system secreted protein Hcp
MRKFCTIPAPVRCAAVLGAIALASPAWSQTIAAGAPRDPQAGKASKVDALTIKQTAAVGYLKIDDIKGESPDARHKEEIEIASWSWGASRAGASAPSGPGTLTITKKVDRSSPKLAEAAAKGRRLNRMTVTLPPAREGDRPARVTLHDVAVSSVQRPGAGPMESISFNYTKIEH